jgi:hypothetical protein
MKPVAEGVDLTWHEIFDVDFTHWDNRRLESSSKRI